MTPIYEFRKQNTIGIWMVPEKPEIFSNIPLIAVSKRRQFSFDWGKRRIFI